MQARRVGAAPDGGYWVDMGPARPFGRGDAKVPGGSLPGLAVSMGNPHLVCLTDADLGTLDLTAQPGFDDGLFPEGVNVEFVQVLASPAEGADAHVRLRVHERGVGETRSCGTGACAAAWAALEATGAASGTVTVDDTAIFTGRFSGGAVASFEATRFALGRKNGIRIELNGSEGSLAFDFEDMNVLEFFDGTEPAERAGFRRIIVTEPEHPYVAAWWPAGHGLGYEHGFTHQVVDLVTAIAAGTDPTPSFADGLQVQRVLDAVERSAADDSRWTPIPGEN